MPRSALTLASLCSAVLLSSWGVSSGSNTLGLLQTDPSLMHQRVQGLVSIAHCPGEHRASTTDACRGGPAPAPMGLSNKACLSFGAWKGLPGESQHGNHRSKAELLALLLPLMTLTARPDGNCSPNWKSCPRCCGTCAPKQLEVLSQCSQPFLQGK